MLTNLRPNHPKIKQLDVKIADAENQIQFLNNEIKNSGKEHLGSIDCEVQAHHIGFAESFRALRSAMLHLPEAHRDRRCIAVTSELPAEGKTTVAVNLAIALAAANRTVLLIDTDLRHGSLHQRLKARQGPRLFGFDYQPRGSFRRGHSSDSDA